MIPQVQIAFSDDPWIKAQIAASSYYPGKLPRKYPHGHWKHVCPESKGREEHCRQALHLRTIVLDPNSFRIERTGGGAAPEGFRLELNGIPVMDDLEGPIEDWSEEFLFENVLEYFHRLGFLLVFPDPARTEAEILNQFAIFDVVGYSWFKHDVEECCYAIDSGAVFQ